ncbi:MAG: site-specific integrase [Sulfuricurvum sp.]|nr:site-specific integrase [Sulfuricurvum sp.]
MKLYSRGGTLYLTYYHGFDRIRKSTQLPDTKENRKFIETKVIPELLYELKYGQKEEKVIPLFDHYAQIYVSEQQNRLKVHTFNKYSRILKNEIMPFFGGQKIDQIKTTDVRVWVNKQLEKVSPKTVAEKLCIIRTIFRYGLEDEIIDRNPVDTVRLPSHAKPDVEPLSADDVRRLLDVAEGWYRNFLAVAVYTGMRTGEMIALRWEDIDMEAGYIRVRHSITRGVLSTPKTLESIRDIPIMPALTKYLKNQFLETGLHGGFVFTVSTGSHVFDASNIRKNYWAQTVKRAGIVYRKPYATRHTFAVEMLNSGKLKVMDIARIMGHTSPQMLMTKYARYIKSEQIKAIDFDPFGLNLGTDDKKEVGETPKIGTK